MAQALRVGPASADHRAPSDPQQLVSGLWHAGQYRVSPCIFLACLTSGTDAKPRSTGLNSSSVLHLCWHDPRNRNNKVKRHIERVAPLRRHHLREIDAAWCRLHSACAVCKRLARRKGVRAARVSGLCERSRRSDQQAAEWQS